MTERAPPAVVLVHPQEEGNVGAVARAMANMGLDVLILVEPAPLLDRVAYAFAVGAGGILDRVQRVDSLELALEPFHRVVGTSSARDRQIGQRIVTPRKLPFELAGDAAETSTALVFGPEPSGLNRDELALCDPLVVVPCASPQPTLNLAQAVLILAYELRLASLEGNDLEDKDQVNAGADGATAASTGEIAQLLLHLEELLEHVGFARDDTFTGVLRDLRQMAARARPTPREVQILHGVCRRAGHALRAARTPVESESE